MSVKLFYFTNPAIGVNNQYRLPDRMRNETDVVTFKSNPNKNTLGNNWM